MICCNITLTYGLFIRDAFHLFGTHGEEVVIISHNSKPPQQTGKMDLARLRVRIYILSEGLRLSHSKLSICPHPPNAIRIRLSHCKFSICHHVRHTICLSVPGQYVLLPIGVPLGGYRFGSRGQLLIKMPPGEWFGQHFL